MRGAAHPRFTMVFGFLIAMVTAAGAQTGGGGAGGTGGSAGASGGGTAGGGTTGATGTAGRSVPGVNTPATGLPVNPGTSGVPRRLRPRVNPPLDCLRPFLPVSQDQPGGRPHRGPHRDHPQWGEVPARAPVPCPVAHPVRLHPERRASSTIQRSGALKAFPAAETDRRSEAGGKLAPLRHSCGPAIVPEL
jgi:hypothetical protein